MIVFSISVFFQAQKTRSCLVSAASTPLGCCFLHRFARMFHWKLGSSQAQKNDAYKISESCFFDCFKIYIKNRSPNDANNLCHGARCCDIPGLDYHSTIGCFASPRSTWLMRVGRYLDVFLKENNNRTQAGGRWGWSVTPFQSGLCPPGITGACRDIPSSYPSMALKIGT